MTDSSFRGDHAIRYANTLWMISSWASPLSSGSAGDVCRAQSGVCIGGRDIAPGGPGWIHDQVIRIPLSALSACRVLSLALALPDLVLS